MQNQKYGLDPYLGDIVPYPLQPAVASMIKMLDRHGIAKVTYTIKPGVGPNGEATAVIHFKTDDPLGIISKATDLYVKAKNRWNTNISTIRIPSTPDEFEMIFIRGTSLNPER